jgi:hypothetical protein
MRRSPEQTRPEYRQLRIFAIDPMVSRGGDHQVTAQMRYEQLERNGADDDHDAVSVRGRRIEIVDVDTSSGTPVWLKCVDLEDAHIAMQHGLEPSESDPQFHQQMVYAVAMRTLEHFDRALGRVVYFSGRRRLRLVPHAFQGSNAFYHPKLRAVLFGYFPASEDSPGQNLPGQMIFTCLSHDIIAHEVTHAVVDRLRPFFNVATNPQVRAFHEAFADIVAVFQRLTFKDLVQRALQEAGGSIAKSPLLSNIASQFGEGLGGGRALRTALDDKTKATDVEEEHALGAVLVAAIFEGFHRTYERRTADLVRIATGGTGELPRGALHPDLVARLTTECCRTAQSVLTMCIRAFDYLPPADVTFAAFLRALVTADWELNPLDEAGLRAAIIEACRRRNIFAHEAGSLAVGALLLDFAPREDWEPHQRTFRTWVDLAVRMLAEEQRADAPPDEEEEIEKSVADVASWIQQAVSSPVEERSIEDVEPEKLLRGAILDWYRRLDPPGRERLGLAADEKVTERGIGFHPSYRLASDGTLRFGLVVQLVEQQKVAIRGEERVVPTGATLVIDVTGRVRFVIRATRAESRLRELEQAVDRASVDAMGWRLEGPPPDPFAVDYRAMHEARGA